MDLFDVAARCGLAWLAMCLFCWLVLIISQAMSGEK